MPPGQRKDLQMELVVSTGDAIRKGEEEPFGLKNGALENPSQESQLDNGGNDSREEGPELNNNAPSQRSMPDLPVEVWTTILGFLPDKNDVRAVVHSSSYLLSLWNENRAHLITTMLKMAPGVLEEAACAANFPTAPVYDSTPRSYGWRDTAVHEIRRHAPFPQDLCISIKLALSFTGNRNRCLANGCNFQDVSKLEKMHPTVRKLADIYIKQCAASNPALSRTVREHPVTLAERVRIERAFYRFEIFRRAFARFEGRWAQAGSRGFYDRDANRDRDRDWLDDPVPAFIQEFKECFNTVELIQLHCIYGFLKRLVTPAINDMLWHDCQLEERNLIEHWATDRRVSVHVLAGLQNVYDIWTAFNDRHMTMLYVLIRMVDYPRGQFHIAEQHDTILYHVLNAELYTGRKSSVEVTKSKIAIHDTDQSPRDACLAVASCIHDIGKKGPGDLRRELDDLAPQRQWGFVMWDRWRLDMMGFFERPHPSPMLRSPFLGYNLTTAVAALVQHRQNLHWLIQARAPLHLKWWEGPLGPAYTLGPRQYDTWYPLAAPNGQGDL